MTTPLEQGQKITLTWDTSSRVHQRFKVPYYKFKYRRVKFLGFDGLGNFRFLDRDRVVRHAPPYAKVKRHRK